MILARLRRAKLLAEKTRIILGNWIRILWFVNFFGEQLRSQRIEPGRNAIGGSIIIIGHLRRRCRKALGRWSRFS